LHVYTTCRQKKKNLNKEFNIEYHSEVKNKNKIAGETAGQDMLEIAI